MDRTGYRRRVGGLIGFVTAGAMITAPLVAAAVNFTLPFVCGEAYLGTTYVGHPLGAIDFNQSGNADNGDPVLASAPGAVSQLIPSNGQVHIDHGGGWETVYAHMSNITVSVSQSVERGQQIGRVSDVGQATGAHLHFQEKLNGSEQYAKFDGVTYVYNTWITSTNCAPQAYADDIAMAKDLGDGTMRLYRLLFDGANNVNNSSTVLSINPSVVADRMVAGDFTNDGVEDVAFVLQKSPGYQVKVVSGATGSPVTYFDTSATYTLSLNEGRLAAGDFDGD